jgi:hypothetical protein
MAAIQKSSPSLTPFDAVQVFGGQLREAIASAFLFQLFRYRTLTSSLEPIFPENHSFAPDPYTFVVVPKWEMERR